MYICCKESTSILLSLTSLIDAAYQNIPPPGMQTDITNSLNGGFNQQYNGQQQYYQQNNVGVNWNQQNATLPNTASLSNSKFYLFVSFCHVYNI